jgi:threonine/homoserine/homoserine lactone efflux protein
VSPQAAVLGFAFVALVLTVTPGLDTALVLRAAITRGRRDAFATALGVIAGVLAWGAAAAVGVSALLAASTVAYDVLRLVGAGYLVWLGGRVLWRLVRHRAAAAGGPVTAAPGGAWRSARTGLLTNLLNPKVGAFYVAVLPQFLPAGTPALAMGVLLALVHAALSLGWFTVLVLGAVAARRWLQRPAVSRTVEGVTGVALLGFGLRLALPGG